MYVLCTLCLSIHSKFRNVIIKSMIMDFLSVSRGISILITSVLSQSTRDKQSARKFIKIETIQQILI